MTDRQDDCIFAFIYHKDKPNVGKHKLLIHINIIPYMDCMGTEKKRLDFFWGVLLTENDFIIHCFILLVFPMGCAGWGKHENSRNTMLPSSWPWVSSVSRLMKYYALMSGSMIKECKDPVFQQPGFHEMNVLGGFYCKPVHLNRRQFRIGKSLRYAPIHVSYLWARMEKSLVHQHAQHATSACVSFPSTLITPLSP